MKKMKIIGLIIFTLVAAMLTAIWNGYVLSKLWLWFIVSAFGADPLGIAQSIGLSLTVSFLTHQYDSYEDKDKSSEERLFGSLLATLLTPTFALLIGWVVKGFLG